MPFSINLFIKKMIDTSNLKCFTFDKPKRKFSFDVIFIYFRYPTRMAFSQHIKRSGFCPRSVITENRLFAGLDLVATERFTYLGKQN